MAELEDRLRAALRAEMDRARRTHAAWRPEVAGYLFERGLVPAMKALPNEGSSAALLEQLWRLMVATIGSRAFGVSTGAWRDHAAYPDRCFPLLWIDLVPAVLPKVAAPQRPALLAELFNLGENLASASRLDAARVMERLVAEVDLIARAGLQDATRSVLVDLGLMPDGEGARCAWTALGPTRLVHVASFDPELLPGALRFEGDILEVADLVRPVALRLRGSGEAAQLHERRTLPEPRTSTVDLPVTAQLPGGVLTVEADGTVLWRADGAAAATVGVVDVRSVASLAIGPRGDIAISRRFSRRVERTGLRA